MNQTLFCLLVVVYAHVSFFVTTLGNAAQSPICRIVDSQQDQRTAPRRTLCPAAHAVSTQWTLYHPSERIETLSAKPKAARKKTTSKKHKLAHVPTRLSHQEIHKTSRQYFKRAGGFGTFFVYLYTFSLRRSMLASASHGACVHWLMEA